MLNETCPICEQPKRFRTTMIGSREFRALTMEGHELCAAELERRAIEDEKRQQREFEMERLSRRLERGFEYSGVSWESKTLDNLKAAAGHKKAVDMLKKWAPGQRGLTICGGPGCGKTHALIGLAKVAAERDCLDFAFLKINPWLDSLRGIDFGKLEAAVKSVESVPLLFIDDLGSEKLTEWTESKIERVIDYRFEFQLPTFISTNLEPAAMADHLTPRLWSRLRGLTEFVKITGDDFRQLTTKAIKK